MAGIRSIAVSLAGTVGYLAAGPLAYILLLTVMHQFEVAEMRQLSTLEYIDFYTSCDHCGRPAFKWQATMFAGCLLIFGAVAYGISRGIKSRGVLMAVILAVPAAVLLGFIPFMLSARSIAGEWRNWFYAVAAVPAAFAGAWVATRWPPNKSLERTREG